MAGAAGLRLEHRWSGFGDREFRDGDERHVSVWRATDRRPLDLVILLERSTPLTDRRAFGQNDHARRRRDESDRTKSERPTAASGR